MLELLKIKLNGLINHNFKPSMLISVFLFNVAKGASEDKISEPEFETWEPEGIAEWEFFFFTAAVGGWMLGHLLHVIFF